VLSRWRPFGAWVFAQLAGRQRVREVVTSLAAPSIALAPLGLTPPKRSTLAEAHERRPAMLYHTLCATLSTRCRALAPGHRFRFKSPLCSLDRTPSSLCLSLFPWARFRRAKGAVKVHTRLDHRGDIPALAGLTEGKRRALTVARELQLPRDSLVAMDRGDLDYRCRCRLPQDGVYGVTRQKVNATCQVSARVAVNRQHGVTPDPHVVLLGQKGTASPTVLRRVGDRDPATSTHDVFWTKAFHLAAATRAAIDTARWQIEVFCKALKQHLKIKTFLGTSKHAVMTQIWVALSTYLMLACRRFQTGLGLAFQPMRRLLHITLFDRRNLVDLCHPPARLSLSGRPLYVA
jgi:hypothetical protein